MSDITFAKIFLSINVIIPLTLIFFTIVRNIKINEYDLIYEDMDEDSEEDKRIRRLKKNTSGIRWLFNIIIYTAITFMCLQLLMACSCCLQMMGREIFSYTYSYIREMVKDYTLKVGICAVIISLLCLAKHMYIMRHIKKSEKYNEEEKKFLKDFFSLKIKD